MMIEKKNFIMAIKRALETGTFNYVGQQTNQFPEQIWKVDQLKIEDQNWWLCNPISKIDLSNNQIPSIPAGIVTLADLQVLRMKNNVLKECPSFLINLPILKSLDLSRNKLQFIPQQISKAPSLVQINFSQNFLQYCPHLDKIKTLQLVFLNNNKLKATPNLGENVKKADLQQNQIKQIFRENFYRCSCLQNINLNKNVIDNIQEGSFSNLKNLIILEMKQNRLQMIKELPNSQKLDSIILSFNRLTEFTYFDRCPNLTVLVLADNKIKNLSKDIIKLKKLKTLDVSNNDLSDLPCEIGFIKSLVRIQLQGNPLKTMRQNIRTGGTEIVKKYLQDRMDPKQKQKLDKSTATSFQKVSSSEYWSKLLHQFTQGGQLILRKMGLQSLDQSVFQKNIKGLNLSENKLNSISQSIYKLDQLKYIIVNSNELQSLPSSLQRLPILEQIQAKNNQLSQFIVTSPYGFPRLHHLDLSANRLKYIPKGILMLQKLRTLYLSYNNITDIQPLLQNPKLIPFLQILDVSNNKLDNISDLIFNRVSLNYLNIQNNNLSRIPTVLGFMKLSGLKIDGNPLKLIKRAVIDKGAVYILQYLRTKHLGQIPQRPDNIIPLEKPQYILKPQKPNYPYETEHKQVKNNQRNMEKQEERTKQDVGINRQQTADNKQFQRQKQSKIKQLQNQIKKLQDQLDNNMGLNTMIKNQKKKSMQNLMIQRNKLIKGE